MKKMSFIIFFISCVISGCHRAASDCVCNKYQACQGSLCACADQWAEGDSCTPMRNKFIGTYIGYLYLNGMNPAIDTISFAVKANTPEDYLYTTKGNGGMHMHYSTQSTYFTNYNSSPNSYKAIDCGVCLLSSDYKTITITYQPVISLTAIDSNDDYTFIGTRQ